MQKTDKICKKRKRPTKERFLKFQWLMDIFAWNNTAASRQLMPNGTAVCHGNGPFTGGTIFRRQSNRRNTRFTPTTTPSSVTVATFMSLLLKVTLGFAPAGRTS